MLETKKWLTVNNLVTCGLGVLVLYFVTTSLVSSRFKDIEANIRLQISDQETLLVTIAETTARNGADTVTESIIKDCSVTERIQFDESLGRLDQGLSQTELVELERLFGRCGAFYSKRKSVMVSRLAREIEIYDNLVKQLSVVTEEDQTTKFLVTDWQALATEEQKQSDMFTSLVTLQDQIITALLTGSTASSPKITDILYQVKEVQDTLVVVNKQATTIRSRLVAL